MPVADHLRIRALAARERVRNLVLSAANPGYSYLFLVSDSPAWSLSWDTRELHSLAHQLGLASRATHQPAGIRRQSVFYASQFALMEPASLRRKNRIGVAYLHGKPAPDQPEFTACYAAFRKHHGRIDRVQVSHSEMHDLVLSTGIAPEKVFRIPIGINLDYFSPASPAARRAERRRLGIPESAVVIGSFQKDGVGWGEGNTPKLIKGPDVFLEAVRRLHARIPEIFVLLTGPARGFVKRGLEAAHIPYRHVYLASFPEVGRLYHALDAYVVASREEGGPKAVLESMASGVPLISTRVGQAMDLVEHGRNGWLVDVGDAEGLAHRVYGALEDEEARQHVLVRARHTAEQHAYPSQLPLWRAFFDGFVEGPRTKSDPA